MSTETRLKPCPFCGGAAKEFERFNANVITCRRCGVKVRQSEMGEGDAAERWNQRATPAAAQPDLTQQTLDDVIAGIPARDAEIEALRKQVETLQAQLVDRSPEMQGKPVDESPNLQAQQQPASGADGLHSSIMEKVQEFASTWATVDGRFDDGTAIDRAEACKTQIGYMLRNALSAQPQSSGNPGQLDHLPDATKMVEPSGNSGELHASFESWRKSELPWTSPATPGIGFAWDAWRARAALAQQDAMLDSRIAADMAAIVETLDEGEWAEHIAKTDLGQRLEHHITQLVGKQQDAEKVDAEPDMFWDDDDPERCQDSIHNVLVEVQCNRDLSVGNVVEVQRAIRLPNVSVRITAVEDEDGSGDLEYEVIDAARRIEGDGE
ncbi:Lar family restriction alleviation protein [Alcaligenes nematophilus]|uniref:Lar family restriction alleviation protein n=1 Tax=Alcaligenes nematophilus TaxID=2994643 RepID=UPI0035B50650